MSAAPIYDIAVTGGGLAGLTLAIQAAKQGYQVILFEKEEYPFHKVCGEYISMESWNFLRSLDIPLEAWNLPVIKKFNASDIKGKLYSFDLPLGGFGVSRHLLDNELYKIAIRKGVKVLTKTKVHDIVFSNELFTTRSSAGDFSSKLAIGSFGKRSNIDVKWNRLFVKQKPNKLNNYIAVKYHIRYGHDADAVTLHNFENGYCGISKIEDGISCLCYLTTADNLSKAGNSIAGMEAMLLHQNPLLKKHLFQCGISLERTSGDFTN